MAEIDWIGTLACPPGMQPPYEPDLRHSRHSRPPRLLSEALAAINMHSGGEAGAVVTIGDYVDKGPDSRGVIERLLAGVDAG